MPDPQQQPLALPMLMQSGATPQQPWVSSFPYQYGADYLNELRRNYEVKKKRLAQLAVEQKLRQSSGAAANTGAGVSSQMAGWTVERQTTSDAQFNLEMQRLQREIKEMERQYSFLTEPNIQGANWGQLLAEKTQADIKAGLISPEEGLKQYSQAQSYLSGTTPPEAAPQAAPGTTWQQPGQPTTGSGQPATPQGDPWASAFGITPEMMAAAPEGFSESLPWIYTGQQPPSTAQQQQTPWYFNAMTPTQQRAYLNMQSGKQNFDPMQFFQQRMEQSSTNKKWQQEMALAERELAARMADQQAQQAYQQQALAQAQQQFEAQLAAEQAYRQQQIEQARREMAAQIGTNLNAQQSQNWAQALPYVLPYGTTTPPGFEAGGPVNTLAAFAGQQNYTPMQISPSPAPERSEMEALIKRAIDAFK
jgi:hypothetical protein